MFSVIRSQADKAQSSAIVAGNKRKYVSSYEFMAASTGNIEWLNQTLKSIQEERGKENVVTFDKNVSFKALLIPEDQLSQGRR